MYSKSVDRDDTHDSNDDEPVPDACVPSTQTIRGHLSDIHVYVNSVEGVNDSIFSALATIQTFVNKRL